MGVLQKHLSVTRRQGQARRKGKNSDIIFAKQVFRVEWMATYVASWRVARHMNNERSNYSLSVGLLQSFLNKGNWMNLCGFFLWWISSRNLGSSQTSLNHATFAPPFSGTAVHLRRRTFWQLVRPEKRTRKTAAKFVDRSVTFVNTAAPFPHTVFERAVASFYFTGKIGPFLCRGLCVL